MATQHFSTAAAGASWSASAASLGAQAGDILYVYCHVNAQGTFSTAGTDPLPILYTDYSQAETSNHAIARVVMDGTETDLQLDCSSGTATFCPVLVRGADTAALEVSGVTRMYNSASDVKTIAGHTSANPGAIIAFGGVDGSGVTFSNITNGYAILDQNNAGRAGFSAFKAVAAGTDAGCDIDLNEWNDGTTFSLRVDDLSGTDHTASPTDTATTTDATAKTGGKGVSDVVTVGDTVTLTLNGARIIQSSYADVATVGDAVRMALHKGGIQDTATVVDTATISSGDFEVVTNVVLSGSGGNLPLHGLTLQAGDLLIVASNWSGDHTDISEFGGQNIIHGVNGDVEFGQREQVLINNDGATCHIWEYIASGTDDDQWVFERHWERPTLSEAYSFHILQLRMASTGTVWDIEPDAAGNGNAVASGTTNAAPSITTSASKTMGLAFCFSDSSTEVTGVDNGFTLLPSTGARTAGIAYKPLNSAGAVGATTFTLAGATNSFTVQSSVRFQSAPVSCQLNMVGPDQHTAEIMVTCPSGLAVAVEYADNPNFINSSVTPTQTGVASNGWRVRFNIAGLTAQARYYYRFIENGGVQDADFEFWTLPEYAKPMDFKIAVTSCKASGNNPKAMDYAIARGAQLMIMQGDSHYQDLAERYGAPTADQFRGALAMGWGGRAAKHVRDRMGVYLQTDDHEIGNNASRTGGVAEFTFSAQDWIEFHIALRQFLPIGHLEHPTAETGGLANPINYSMTFGNVKLIYPDGRTERDAGNARVSAGQLTWITDEIAAADADLFTASLCMFVGVPWVVSGGGDNWSEAPAQRTAISNAIGSTTTLNVQSFAGDMHGLAFDDGTNNNYGTGSWPHFQCGPWGSDASDKGGPYSGGTSAVNNGAEGQYGLITFDSVTTAGVLSTTVDQYSHGDVLWHSYNNTSPVPIQLKEADTATVADTPKLGAGKAATDVASTADAAALSGTLVNTDTATASDAPALTTGRPEADTATAADTAALKVTRAPQDGVTAADAPAKDVVNAPADTALAGDTPTKAVTSGAADTATAWDVMTYAHGTSRHPVDAADASDAAALAVGTTAEDTATATEGSAANTGKGAADAANTTDQPSAATGKGLTDTATASDAVTVHHGQRRKVDDTATASDAVALRHGYTRQVDDTATAGDGQASTTGKTIADTAVAADAAVVSHGQRRTANDTATASDSMTYAVGTGVAVDDTATVSDASAQAVGKPAADTATATDNATPSANYVRRQQDSAAVADAIAQGAHKVSTDIAGATEIAARRIRLYISDTGNVSDAVGLRMDSVQTVIETINAADEIRITLGKGAADAATVSDDARVLAAQEVIASDGVTITDSVAIITVLSTMDAATVGDAVSVQSSGGNVHARAPIDSAVATDQLAKHIKLVIRDQVSSISTPPGGVIFALLD